LHKRGKWNQSKETAHTLEIDVEKPEMKNPDSETPKVWDFITVWLVQSPNTKIWAYPNGYIGELERITGTMWQVLLRWLEVQSEKNRKIVGREQRLLKSRRVHRRVENTRQNNTCVRRTLEHEPVMPTTKLGTSSSIIVQLLPPIVYLP